MARTIKSDLFSYPMPKGSWGGQLHALGNGYNLSADAAAEHADAIVAHLVKLGWKARRNSEGHEFTNREVRGTIYHQHGGKEPGQSFLF